jgi:2'-5' RNA ligase
VRLFFALWPDAETRTRIAEVAAAAAQSLGREAQPVPPENYHVTLVFVGDVPNSRLAVLQQAGRAQRAAGCTIQVDTYEYWREPQVLVAAASQSPAALILLQTGLHQELVLRQADLRLKSLSVSLRAHVTLARKVVQASVLQAMSPLLWCARSFSLVRSETSGAHSVYTVVDTWPLLDEMAKQ